MSLPMNEPYYFLPGPVSISKEVRKSFARLPISHRCSGFLELFQHIKQRLCLLVQAKNVEIMLGSGTLANDVIAGQLSLLNSKGLILSNGEFGDRLIDHSERFGLSFKSYRRKWGEAFDFNSVKKNVEDDPAIKWIWMVHCESSTGILNDQNALEEICLKNKIHICLDCISSIGTIPVDLSRIYLASCVSGKGFGAFPGLALIFYNCSGIASNKKLPRYFDLGFYAEQQGIPFTHSSNLINALYTALSRFDSDTVYEETKQLSLWMRSRMRELGFQIVAPDDCASPAIITIALPSSISSETVGGKMEKKSYFLSYKSKYLLERNWIQICMMGDCSQKALTKLLYLLTKEAVKGYGTFEKFKKLQSKVSFRGMAHTAATKK